MSGADVKKPETREEFIKMLTEAAKKEVDSKNKPTKPTKRLLSVCRQWLLTKIQEALI
jgi:hypothetical protein